MYFFFASEYYSITPDKRVIHGEYGSSFTIKWNVERLKPDAKIKTFYIATLNNLLGPSSGLVITEFRKTQELQNDAYKGHVAMHIHEETSNVTVIVTIENLQEEHCKPYFLKLELEFDGWECSCPNCMIHILSPKERGELATIFLCVFSTNTNTSIYNFEHTTTNTHTYK